MTLSFPRALRIPRTLVTQREMTPVRPVSLPFFTLPAPGVPVNGWRRPLRWFVEARDAVVAPFAWGLRAMESVAKNLFPLWTGWSGLTLAMAGAGGLPMRPPAWTDGARVFMAMRQGDEGAENGPRRPPTGAAEDYRVIAKMAERAAEAEGLEATVQQQREKIAWLEEILRRRVAERNEAAQRANGAEAQLVATVARQNEGVVRVTEEIGKNVTAVTTELTAAEEFLRQLAASPLIVGAAVCLDHVQTALQLLRTFTPTPPPTTEAASPAPIPLVTEPSSPARSTPRRWEGKSPSETDISALVVEFHERFPNVPDDILRYYVEYYATLPSMRKMGDVRSHVRRAVTSCQSVIEKIRGFVAGDQALTLEEKTAVVNRVVDALNKHLLAGGALTRCWSHHGPTERSSDWLHEANGQIRKTAVTNQETEGR